jgi:hypothetical protein
MFQTYSLPVDRSFEELSKVTTFGNVCKGRVGAVIVDDSGGGVPIIRTTTRYTDPVQRFAPLHSEIIASLNEILPCPVAFNNAMVETYTPEYNKMGFHTDQSLDMEDDSYIGIFSCYKDTVVSEDLRTLTVENKLTNETSTIRMGHNSMVLFSTDTNRLHRHKITLESQSTNTWLGVTMRLSKTLIDFIDGVPYMRNPRRPLRLASEAERGRFYQLKGVENRTANYVNPDIDFTISQSDLMPMASYNLRYSC